MDEVFALPAMAPPRLPPQAVQPPLERPTAEKVPREGQQAGLPGPFAAAAAGKLGDGQDPWQQSQPAEGRSSEACSTREMAAVMLNAGSPDSISSASLSPAALLPSLPHPQPRQESAIMQPSQRAHASAAVPQQLPQQQPQRWVQSADPAQGAVEGDGPDMQDLVSPAAVLRQQQQQRQQQRQLQRDASPAEQPGPVPLSTSLTAAAACAAVPAVQQMPALQPPLVQEPRPQPRSRGASSLAPAPRAAASLAAPGAAALAGGKKGKPPAGKADKPPRHQCKKLKDKS